MKHFLFIVFSFFITLVRAQPKVDTFKCFFEPVPQFPGGQDSLKRYLAKNIIYPNTAADVEGRVIVRFIITPTGSVDSVRVFRSLHPDFDKEAIRVILAMPKWIPVKNQKQNIWYTMPVNFRLE